MRLEPLELGLQERLAALGTAHGLELLRVLPVQALLDLQAVLFGLLGVVAVHEAQLERLVTRLDLPLRDLEPLDKR